MELFQISDVQKDEIYKSYGVTEESIAEDVTLIEEWIKKQPHLPKNFQYEFFPYRMLIANKFSVERAKERIEKYFTLKRRCREFFTVFDNDEYVKPINNTVCILPLPKLGPQNERIVFVYFKTPDAELYTIQHYFQSLVTAVELINMYDRTACIRFIVDGKNYTLAHLKKIDINGCLKSGDLAIKGYGVPLISIDYVNINPTTTFIVSLTRKILSSKLLQRFKLHDNLESLYETIPREYLPEEYGGTACKLSDVTKKMDIEKKNHRKIFAESANYASDESLRVDGTGLDIGVNFGLDGTFKKLDLD